MKFAFWGSSGQKVQIWKKNWDMLGQIGPHLKKYKYLVEE